MVNIEIKEGTAEQAIKLNDLVPEFKGNISDQFFPERMGNPNPLVLIAYQEGKEAGYMFGYDKFADGSYYCSRAAVVPEYRRNGILKEMMKRICDFAKEKGYKKMRIATKNERREMLLYLIKEGYNLLEVKQKEGVDKYRIELEKGL